MKSRFPFKQDGDWLIYHRLTGLRPGATVNEVVRYMDDGFKLQPYSLRHENDTELFGLDPIDLAAGDGGAVFCTPFQPYTVLTSKMWMRRQPGVAFRLSDLWDRHQLTLRPTDFQKFYSILVNRSPLRMTYETMQNSVDLYDQGFYLSKLSRALELIRTAETTRVETALDTIVDGTAGQHFGYTDEVPHADIDAAADEALEFVYEIEDPEDPQFSADRLLPGITSTVYEAWSLAQAEWDEVETTEVEVLVWGEVPLSLAVLVFDESGFCTPEVARAKRTCR